MFAFILSFFAVLALGVQAQISIDEVPLSCRAPSANPVCPPKGTLSFSACGDYTRGKSCRGLCFGMVTQYLVGSGTSCFSLKPSFVTTRKLYRECRRQCIVGRSKLRRSRVRNAGVLITVGAASSGGKIKGTHILYEIVKPAVCGGGPGEGNRQCGDNVPCFCSYCRFNGHRCPDCC